MAGMTQRPRLLFLCQTLPFPPDGGVWIRTYHVLRLLAQAFDITALCFERAHGSSNGTNADNALGCQGLSSFAAVEVFAFRRGTAECGSRGTICGARRRAASTRGTCTTRAPFQQRLTALLASGDFDLVHVDSLDLARYLPACAESSGRVRPPRRGVDAASPTRRARRGLVAQGVFALSGTADARRGTSAWCERSP